MWSAGWHRLSDGVSLRRVKIRVSGRLSVGICSLSCGSCALPRRGTIIRNAALSALAFAAKSAQCKPKLANSDRVKTQELSKNQFLTP